MGFRIRKSFGKGPFRVNISKSGIGYSVGTKGIRYTQRAGGGTRLTTSIPGTGLSFTEDFGSINNAATMDSHSVQEKTATAHQPGSSGTRYCKHCYRMLMPGVDICPACGKSQSDRIAKPIYKRVWFWILAIPILIGSCAPSNSDTPAPTEPTYIVETTAADEGPRETEAYISTAENDVDTTSIDSGYIQEDKTESSEKTYVLNTNTKKFHKSNCSSVKDIKPSNKSTVTDTREAVMARGYEPCGRCGP